MSERDPVAGLLSVIRNVLRLAIVVVGLPAVIVAMVTSVVPRVADVAGAGEAEAAEIVLDSLDNRSLMLASDGSVMTALHAEINRDEVLLEDIPSEIVDAVLAVEDAAFYEHDGVSVRSVARAMFANLGAGGVEEGGSTITQQLVKNTLLTNEQTLERKTRELALALQLEEQFTKDEILERYLNTIYFGRGAYGVQAAAEVYWGVGVEELGWAEAALLAALIRGPSIYDPYIDAGAAQERRSLVLGVLREAGHLTDDEVVALERAPLPLHRREVVAVDEDYWVAEVKRQLFDLPALGATRQDRIDRVFGGGLRVHTTLDPELQRVAEETVETYLPEGPTELARLAVESELDRADESGRITVPVSYEATIVTVDPSSGALRAMVGGPGFDEYQYNLATQAKNQPGSTFKTLVLVEAFDQGYVPSDTIDGRYARWDLNGEPYEPKSGCSKSSGSLSLTRATTSSNNCAFLRLGQAVGLDEVVDLSERLGFESELAFENEETGERAAPFSLPLGVREVTALEMASSYGAIANDGVYHRPYVIERIEDRDGDVIYEHRLDGNRTFSRQVARLATEVLEDNVRSGTGRNARVGHRCNDHGASHPTAGKTGTVAAGNEQINRWNRTGNTDAWFVGFSPHLATAVWIGSPDAEVPMQGMSGVDRCGGRYSDRMQGGTFPALMWGAFMGEAHRDLEPAEFADPDRTRRSQVVREDGTRSAVSSSSSRSSSSRSSSSRSSSRSSSSRSSSRGSSSSSSGGSGAGGSNDAGGTDAGTTAPGDGGGESTGDAGSTPGDGEGGSSGEDGSGAGGDDVGGGGSSGGDPGGDPAGGEGSGGGADTAGGGSGSGGGDSTSGGGSSGGGSGSSDTGGAGSDSGGGDSGGAGSGDGGSGSGGGDPGGGSGSGGGAGGPEVGGGGGGAEPPAEGA